MKAKAVGVTAAFTALASMLNLLPIPTPFLFGYSYQLGDIILVIAFFLFGLKIGLTTVALNMAVSMTLNPNAIGMIGAPYYVIAILTMILGSYISLKIIKKRNLKPKYGEAKSAALATLFAVITRTLIMLPLDLFVYGFLVSFVSGWSVAASFALVTSMMPLIVLYNITVPLYVIPVSYYFAKRVPTQINSALFEYSIV
jgi:riboflavin transporter FmnP